MPSLRVMRAMNLIMARRLPHPTPLQTSWRGELSRRRLVCNRARKLRFMNRNDALRASHLKLGLFGANVSAGRTYHTAPERWVASWQNNVTLAQMADEAGLECMVPIA